MQGIPEFPGEIRGDGGNLPRKGRRPNQGDGPGIRDQERPIPGEFADAAGRGIALEHSPFLSDGSPGSGAVIMSMGEKRQQKSAHQGPDQESPAGGRAPTAPG